MTSSYLDMRSGQAHKLTTLECFWRLVNITNKQHSLKDGGGKIACRNTVSEKIDICPWQVKQLQTRAFRLLAQSQLCW